MTETRRIKVKHAREGFRDKISDLVEEIWDKISQHHRAATGEPGGRVAADARLSDSETVLTYTLELPGLDEDDVQVSVEAGRLAIRGEKRDEREREEANYVFRERWFGRFERVFALPASAEEEGIKARFSKGVLTVTIPCRSEPGGVSRKIEISAD